jgi:hypothetical protein
MIVEDERDSFRVRYDDNYESEYDQPSSSSTLSGFGHGPIHGFLTLLEVEEDIRN